VAEAAHGVFRDGAILWEGRRRGAAQELPTELYHCTSLRSGLNICLEGMVRNSANLEINAVYCTCDLSNRFYDAGCTVVLRPVGVVPSRALFWSLVDEETQQLPSGVVITLKKSVVEWIADESTLQIKELWFDYEHLASFLNEEGLFAEGLAAPRTPGLQPRHSRSAAAHSWSSSSSRDNVAVQEAAGQGEGDGTSA